MATRSPATDGFELKALDVICVSHLRWSFVFQRPQHLLTRAARDRRVFYVEEPVWSEGPARLELRTTPEGVVIAVPHLPHGTTSDEAEFTQRALLDDLIASRSIESFVLWYYTPMALAFTRHLAPEAVIFDVMDELSLFRFAPADLLDREEELFRWADVVFAGGASLYESKRLRHPNTHLFPSSVDASHFAAARTQLPEPADQLEIPHPRLGFFGVIDERMDLDLLAGVAEARPDWQIVLLGPVAKVDWNDLPRRSNIHYLGPKEYSELPAYAGGWDVALMPWARNEATRFISPTKTPEYLAAGLSVVSTPIEDVVSRFRGRDLVRFGTTAAEFVTEVELALAEPPAERAAWLLRADTFLASSSWESTWQAMWSEFEATQEDPGQTALELSEPLQQAGGSSNV